MDNGASNYRQFCNNGDDSGLAEIIKEYKDGLILFLTNIVGDINIADDIAEDTFVLIGTKKPKFKESCSFKTWLYAIGRNIAVDYLRKSRKHLDVSIYETYELIDEEADLEALYIREERKIIVHRALRQLKKEYQQVLWLIYFEELSNKETAKIMKKSVHNIETLVYRARNALKNQLEKEGFNYENL